MNRKTIIDKRYEKTMGSIAESEGFSESQRKAMKEIFSAGFIECFLYIKELMKDDNMSESKEKISEIARDIFYMLIRKVSELTEKGEDENG